MFDDFENLFFKGSQLGHNILGDAENLDRFTQEVCRRYITTSYTPSRMTAFYRGSMSPARVRDIAERCFAALPAGGEKPERETPPIVAPFTETKNIDSHQAHTVIGARVPSLFSPERYALGLMTNILGGPGMNSRLNIALRENRGLVYTVHPIATEPLTVRALEAAKKQYLGQLIVSSDNNEQMALNNGRSTLFYGSVTPPDQVKNAILSLTPADILNAAAYVRPTLTSRLTLR